MSNIKADGFSLPALFLGPFLYLANKMSGKGIFLLTLSVLSLGLAIPFIWIYCSFRYNRDNYENLLKSNSRIDPRRISIS